MLDLRWSVFRQSHNTARSSRELSEYQSEVRRRWPLVKGSGDGRYAAVSFCGSGPRVWLFDEERERDKKLVEIDWFGCGGEDSTGQVNFPECKQRHGAINLPPMTFADRMEK